MPDGFLRSCLGLLLISALLTFGSSAMAEGPTKGPSGLPLPRFVSLKSSRVNLRIGPGTDYATAWTYQKGGLPVEIIQEYDNWRKIRDSDGTEGWVNQILLSGDRTALAAPWMRGKGDDVFVNMHDSADSSATVIAKLQPGVIIRLSECTGKWCRGEVGDTKGWVAQNQIWGAYPGEAFK
ncbi:SH3 domain-containing protein [Allorhizobium sp. BGMRC 0089]|uniref:SH3 domain-containing protein n=1 Tax=Allorhizobium sonneratiae TaxID=2934936 RepID=UPI002034552B|nr:SH3 domain-containing protein [Allorhizobium sonneratiae]MCM2291654.1 SH3 domain-containing protein [Allorhizobium sonneratiae]